MTLKQVESDLLPIAQRLAQANPKDFPKRFSITASSYVDSIVGPFRKTLLTLTAAVSLLLLIACVNVANMLLARSTARDREMAIRSALGASRWRVVRQLLVESVILGIGGAVLGCGLAWGGIKALVALIPDGAIPQEAAIGLDWPALWFSLGLAVCTAVVFGLAPAMQTARRDIVEPLKDSGRGVSGGFRRGRLRNVLVVVELALSLVLLTGAGVMIRTFLKLQATDLGFNPKNILVARLPFPKGQYKTVADKQRFFTQLLARVKALPGIVDATSTSGLPPYGGIGTDVDIPGKTHADRWRAMYQLVSEDYIRTLGAKLVRGRMLDANDVAGARKVAVINQTLAAKWFAQGRPAGAADRVEEFRGRRGTGDRGCNLRDCGCDERHEELRTAGPHRAGAADAVHMHGELRTRNPGADDGQSAGLVKRGAAGDLGGRPECFADLDAQPGGFSQRLLLRAAAVHAAGAGSIRGNRPAAGGGGGVQRNRVYGFAADARDWDPHGAGGKPRRRHRDGTADGAMADRGRVGGGVGASLMVSKVLSSELFGVSARDPLTFAAVSVVVLASGVAACWFPAMRATRIDPTVALRSE